MGSAPRQAQSDSRRDQTAQKTSGGQPDHLTWKNQQNDQSRNACTGRHTKNAWVGKGIADGGLQERTGHGEATPDRQGAKNPGETNIPNNSVEPVIWLDQGSPEV